MGARRPERTKPNRLQAVTWSQYIIPVLLHLHSILHFYYYYYYYSGNEKLKHSARRIDFWKLISFFSLSGEPFSGKWNMVECGWVERGLVDLLKQLYSWSPSAGLLWIDAFVLATCIIISGCAVWIDTNLFVCLLVPPGHVQFVVFRQRQHQQMAQTGHNWWTCVCVSVCDGPKLSTLSGNSLCEFDCKINGHSLSLNRSILAPSRTAGAAYINSRN